MKKIYVALLLTLLLLTGCGKKEVKKEEKVSTSTPLLIEVSKEESNTKLYLFGSIHAANDELYPFPDYVLNAYQKSDALAVEFDLIEYEKDISGQMETAALLVYDDGSQISDHIPEDLYEDSKNLLEEGNSYISIYDYYKPTMWMSLIENMMAEDAGLDTSKGVDYHFLKKAKQDQKEIIELETAEFQMNMLTGFSDELQELLLASSVMEYDKSVESLKKLFNLYQKGDKEELEKILSEEDDINEEYSENAMALAEEYNDALITSRNKEMTLNLEKYFAEGKNVFCVVGLAHIIGEDGIADLLEQKGYEIKIIKGEK